ncbi:hypothetical protein [Streptomyces sp. bgisy027]|uniref:hypothetical protein n=1 Tax=Streptomyces sp. bgisy027 TaxID=3413770 RepID=UPI003D759330
MTNEKRLPERAGLRGVDEILGALRPRPTVLLRAITDAETLSDEAAARSCVHEGGA